jgi:F-type H+-transporting ATPase subunit epsilon
MAFRCVIVTPEQQALDDSVEQVIIPAWDGQIGILTGHSALLVKLGLGVLRVDFAGGKTKSFMIDGGVAQMKGDHLTIITDDAIAAEDVDVQSAKAEYAEAEARVPTDTKTREQRTKQMARARVQQELAVHK